MLESLFGKNVDDINKVITVKYENGDERQLSFRSWVSESMDILDKKSDLCLKSVKYVDAMCLSLMEALPTEQKIKFIDSMYSKGVIDDDIYKAFVSTYCNLQNDPSIM